MKQLVAINFIELEIKVKKILTRDRLQDELPKRVLATRFCLIVK